MVEQLGAEVLVLFEVDSDPIGIDALAAARAGESPNALLGYSRRAVFTARIPGRPSISPGEELALVADPRHVHTFSPESYLAVLRRSTAPDGGLAPRPAPIDDPASQRSIGGRHTLRVIGVLNCPGQARPAKITAQPDDRVDERLVMPTRVPGCRQRRSPIEAEGTAPLISPFSDGPGRWSV